MQNASTNLFLRDDTFFGVCQGIGEDLGISPNILRVAFAPLLFFSWQAAIGIYAGLGLLVLTTRLLVPNPKAAKAATPEAQPIEREGEAEPLPIAA